MKLWIALCVWVLLSPAISFWVARFFYVSEPQQSRDDLTDADRIWREDTAFNAINSGALPPRTGPGAGSPRFTRSGNVLNSNFHAAIPNQKGQRDNV